MRSALVSVILATTALSLSASPAPNVSQRGRSSFEDCMTGVRRYLDFAEEFPQYAYLYEAAKRTCYQAKMRSESAPNGAFPEYRPSEK